MGILDKVKEFIDENMTIKNTNSTYYSGYPEQPYISDERNMKEWNERIAFFPKQSLVPIENMTRNKDGLLPGHIYMLYWLKKFTNKKIPVYFEYEYGIDFEKEKCILLQKKLLNESLKPTPEGANVLVRYHAVVDARNRKAQKGTPTQYRDLNDTIALSNDLVENNLNGISLEKQGITSRATVLYEYNVKKRFEGSHPYTRLCIIYRKKHMFTDEIRVANSAIKNLSQSNKKQYFLERIQKAKELLRKNDLQ